MKNILVLALNKQINIVNCLQRGVTSRNRVQAYSHKQLLPSNNLNELGRGSPVSDGISALANTGILVLGGPEQRTQLLTSGNCKIICINLIHQVCGDLLHSNRKLIPDFPGGSIVKNLPANAGDTGNVSLILRLGRSPGGGNGNALQFSCLEKFCGHRSLAG